MHEVILRETVRRADLYPLRPIVQYLHTLRNDLLEIAIPVDSTANNILWPEFQSEVQFVNVGPLI